MHVCLSCRRGVQTFSTVVVYRVKSAPPRRRRENLSKTSGCKLKLPVSRPTTTTNNLIVVNNNVISFFYKLNMNYCLDVSYYTRTPTTSPTNTTRTFPPPTFILKKLCAYPSCTFIFGSKQGSGNRRRYQMENVESLTAQGSGTLV